MFNSCSYAINESKIIDELNKECLETTNDLNTKSSEYDVSSQRIFASVEELINSLNKIGIFAESITDIAQQTNLLALNEDKDSVISAIASISAVTEQTAASTEELASTTQTQLDIFEKMRNTSDKLNSCTKEMNDTLKKLNL